MDLTKSQNPNAMTLGSAKIEITQSAPVVTGSGAAKDWALINLFDLGLARGVKITPASTKVEVKADNGTVPLRGLTDRKVTVDFSLLERHLPILAIVMGGIVNVVAEPGVLASYTDIYPVGSVTRGALIPFKRFDYSGVKPQAIVIKQGTGGGAITLIEGEDYEIVQYAGAWYFLINSPEGTGLFDPAKDVRPSYDLTPAVSWTMSHGSAGVASALAMKLTNKRRATDGRIISRTWEFPYGFYSSEDAVTLKSKADADNVAEVPMQFEFTPHPDFVLDEYLEPKSLLRENQQA